MTVPSAQSQHIQLKYIFGASASLVNPVHF